MNIKFEDIREEIINELKIKMSELFLFQTTSFSLIEGFIHVRGYSDLNNPLASIMIPCVGVINNDNGRVYTYALKVILPGLDI